jgi:hypothetical protein
MFPLPTFVDRSGRIKQHTLESFLLHSGWHKPNELVDDPALGVMWEPAASSRKIQMRLTRYTRQGLLSRRKARRGYEYSLARGGENRLMYLWQKFGEDTKIDDPLTPEEEKLRIAKISQMIKNLDARIALLSGITDGRKSEVHNGNSSRDANFSANEPQALNHQGGGSIDAPVRTEDVSNNLLLLDWKKNNAGVYSVPREQLSSSVQEYMKQNGWFKRSAEYYFLQIGGYFYVLSNHELLRTR